MTREKKDCLECSPSPGAPCCEYGDIIPSPGYSPLDKLCPGCTFNGENNTPCPHCPLGDLCVAQYPKTKKPICTFDCDRTSPDISEPGDGICVYIGDEERRMKDREEYLKNEEI